MPLIVVWMEGVIFVGGVNSDVWGGCDFIFSLKLLN